MENIINYYYNLNIINTQKYNYYYLITTEDNKYLFTEINNEEELKNILNYLNKTNILYHLLVLTKDNNMFINYENKTYGLFKIRTTNTYNIFTFNKYTNTSNCNWGDLWSKRIDYYLQQLTEIVDIPEIKYAMDYYIGLAEIAISYFNNLNDYYTNNDKTYCLSHHLINTPLNDYNFLNPVNMCFDLSIRDLAEYIKYSFFEDHLTKTDILNLINQFPFNDCLANYFLDRLIYPSYIFHIYDNYIENKTIDNKFYLYMNKSLEYENLLSIIYNKLKLNYNIRGYIYFFKNQQ